MTEQVLEQTHAEGDSCTSFSSFLQVFQTRCSIRVIFLLQLVFSGFDKKMQKSVKRDYESTPKYLLFLDKLKVVIVANLFERY